MLLQHSGLHYRSFMKALSALLNPQTYFEIGTNKGFSLAQVPDADAICVDPDFQLEANPMAAGRKRGFLFQTTSDIFFAENDIRVFFPGGIDLAFLDGMHCFEFLLRDILNTERFCHKTSVMLIHDCLPLNVRMTNREFVLDETEPEPMRFWWAGDVWRVLPILARFRPDLRICFFDCPPTGLVAVSNLDSHSSLLAENYADILSEFSVLSLAEYGIDRLWNLYPTLSTNTCTEDEVLAALFSRA